MSTHKFLNKNIHYTRLLVLVLFSSITFAGYIKPELQTILDTISPYKKTPVIVHLVKQGDLSIFPSNINRNEKIAYLMKISNQAQESILRYLRSIGDKVVEIKSFWITNCIAFSSTPDIILSIAQRDEVEYVIDDFIIHLDLKPSKDIPEPTWNIQKVEADICWSLGYTGTGILVGNIDSGVEVNHPALIGKWRSIDGWFDAINHKTSPYDDYGHGTHTMGIICGGDGLGPYEYDIGIAPDVTFICAKAFDEYGYGSASQIHSALNWVAGLSEPPDVLSNSWHDPSSERNSTEFWEDCLNLKNLGMILVFSIRNITNAGPETSWPPGSFPAVIGTGATDSNDDIAHFSCRGPAPDDHPWNHESYWPRLDWNRINPAISAPGVGIFSSYLNGEWLEADGTSQACPHVTGCVALMLQKNSNLAFNLVFKTITDNANQPSQGSPYPNNNYGWGRLNCLKTLRRTSGPPNPNYRVDNLIKNWWKTSSAYVGDNQYTSGREQCEYQYTDPEPNPNNFSYPAIYHIKIENDGIVPDIFEVKATEDYAPGTWKVRYFDNINGGNDITAQIKSDDGWSTEVLGSGHNREIRVEVAAGTDVSPRIEKGVTISSRSFDKNKIDVVYAGTIITILQPDNQIKNYNEVYYIGNDYYNSTGYGQTKEQWRCIGQKAIYHIKIQNDGEYIDFVHINGTGSDPLWSVKYFDALTGGSDITEYVVNPDPVNPYWIAVPYQDERYIRADITPLSKYSNRKECLITSRSGYNFRKLDAVKAITKGELFREVVPYFRATGPNQGELLSIDGQTGNIHFVYNTGTEIAYTKSTDEGLTWIDVVKVDSGFYPSIALDSSRFPRITYLKNDTVFCQILKPDSSWDTVVIFGYDQSQKPKEPALAPSYPPELANYSYSTFSTEDPFSANSMINFSIFDITEDIAPSPNEVATGDSLKSPSIAITPGDYVHIVWEQKGEIYYRTSLQPLDPEEEIVWSDIFNVSGSPMFYSGHPVVEAYGENIIVAWKEGNPGEIYRRIRNINSDVADWSEIENISQTSTQESDYPVLSTQDVVTWQEQIDSLNYEIYAWIQGDIVNLSETENSSKYPHIAVEPQDFTGDTITPAIVINTIWTETVIPDSLYEVRFRCYEHNQGADGISGMIEYISVSVGDSIASPYCKKRDGFIQYGVYTLDYSRSSLVYNLPYLKPRSSYLIRALVYQGERDRWREKMYIDDSLAADIYIDPKIPRMVNIVLPKASFGNDLEINKEIRRILGRIAIVADLKVYEVNLPDTMGDKEGALANREDLIRYALYQNRPNPFKDLTKISFALPKECNVSLFIYDITGRRVRTLINGKMQPGNYNYTWDGKDNRNRRLTQGVYFYRLQTEDFKDTKKTVLLK